MSRAIATNGKKNPKQPAPNSLSQGKDVLGAILDFVPARWLRANLRQ